MLNTACVLVTGWNYMAALKTVYAPLNTYRKTIIYGMQFIFFAAAGYFPETAFSWFFGFWNDHPGIHPDDLCTGTDRCDHCLAEGNLCTFSG